MKKIEKVFIGIIVISVIDFIFAFGLFISFFVYGKGSFADNIYRHLSHPIGPFVSGFILALPVFIAGVSTLKLKKLGRKLNIYMFALCLISIFVICFIAIILAKEPVQFSQFIIPLLLSTAVLVFLTRSKVKEQFK